MDATTKRIDRARNREKIAGEVIAFCQRVRELAFDRGAALTLHDLHARHSRELGQHEMAERAEERFDRELNRLTHRRPDRD